MFDVFAIYTIEFQIEQFDAKIAFLHCDLEERICIWSSQKGLRLEGKNT